MKKLTFSIVTSAPEKTSQNELVLSMPTWLDEIKACEKRKGAITRAAPNYLRAIAEEIARRHDRRLNAYRHIIPSNYTGLDIATDEATAEVVHKMFKDTYPAIYPAYVESSIKNRNYNVDHIWWVGSEDMRQVFLDAGAEEIKPAQAGSIKKVEEIIESKVEEAPEVVEEKPKNKQKKKKDSAE